MEGKEPSSRAGHEVPCHERSVTHVETVENRKRGLVIELIQKALDRDGNGQLEPEERASARLIIYGQSFGGVCCREGNWTSCRCRSF